MGLKSALAVIRFSVDLYFGSGLTAGQGAGFERALSAEYLARCAEYTALLASSPLCTERHAELWPGAAPASHGARLHTESVGRAPRGKGAPQGKGALPS